jgi:hypothetical protein
LSYPIECLDAGSGAARAHRDEIRELKIEVATLGSEAAELRAALADARARAIGVDRRSRVTSELNQRGSCLLSKPRFGADPHPDLGGR